jgi:type IV pilus assembly protein PilE
MNHSHHRQRAFGLIELMAAVAIIAIMASIALPAYGQYMVRANRAAAQAHLLDLAQIQQQYRADNRAYAATLDDLGTPTPAAVASRYTITMLIDAGPPASFIATATPITGTKQHADGALSIDSAGRRTPTALW